MDEAATAATREDGAEEELFNGDRASGNTSPSTEDTADSKYSFTTSRLLAQPTPPGFIGMFTCDHLQRNINIYNAKNNLIREKCISLSVHG